MERVLAPGGTLIVMMMRRSPVALGIQRDWSLPAFPAELVVDPCRDRRALRLGRNESQQARWYFVRDSRCAISGCQSDFRQCSQGVAGGMRGREAGRLGGSPETGEFLESTRA